MRGPARQLFVWYKEQPGLYSMQKTHHFITGRFDDKRTGESLGFRLLKRFIEVGGSAYHPFFIRGQGDPLARVRLDEFRQIDRGTFTHMPFLILKTVLLSYESRPRARGKINTRGLPYTWTFFRTCLIPAYQQASELRWVMFGF